jgi:hypothetical protein
MASCKALVKLTYHAQTGELNRFGGNIGGLGKVNAPGSWNPHEREVAYPKT